MGSRSPSSTPTAEGGSFSALQQQSANSPADTATVDEKLMVPETRLPNVFAHQARAAQSRALASSVAFEPRLLLISPRRSAPLVACLGLLAGGHHRASAPPLKPGPRAQPLNRANGTLQPQSVRGGFLAPSWHFFAQPSTTLFTREFRRIRSSLAYMRDHSATCRRRSALTITETELRLIAALASIGLSSQQVNG